jgi:hypothetical protein
MFAHDGVGAGPLFLRLGEPPAHHLRLHVVPRRLKISQW